MDVILRDWSRPTSHAGMRLDAGEIRDAAFHLLDGAQCLEAGANPTTKTGVSTCLRSFQTSLFLLRQGASAMDFIRGKRDKEGKLAALGLTKTEFVCRS
jgi:hypothetical protein